MNTNLSTTTAQFAGVIRKSQSLVNDLRRLSMEQPGARFDWTSGVLGISLEGQRIVLWDDPVHPRPVASFSVDKGGTVASSTVSIRAFIYPSVAVPIGVSALQLAFVRERSNRLYSDDEAAKRFIELLGGSTTETT
ncbi:hypothetical protein [Herbiconiux sp. UC225_62]|uniref:hypothetical protein n=1 Tax=Herbiconiux sp. UC225_62 TaxID=3350168 RepID=UPI0036D434EC